jgi:hypothetical protein
VTKLLNWSKTELSAAIRPSKYLDGRRERDIKIMQNLEFKKLYFSLFD